MRQKAGRQHAWSYYNNYLIDNDSCIVVGVQATGARLSEEPRSARDMITRFAQWQGRKPTICRCRCELWQRRGVLAVADGPGDHSAYMPTRDAVGRTRSPFYGPESFTYLPESNSYICPGGQQLNYGGRNERKLARSAIKERARSAARANRDPSARLDRSGILRST